MAHTLDKTRKQIAKKKGALGAIHEGSRDSRRLRKAILRDGRLEKLASARRKQEKPISMRPCTCVAREAKLTMQWTE